MDKYEYKLKLEQLKNLVEEKDYKTAAEIADSINWRKVKSAATLCMVGEIYDRNKRYEESREILLMAYDRAAVGRNILYRLTLVSLKMGDLDEAKGYYEDFLDVAPYDNRKYILRYQIAKLGGADLQELIDILEEFKSREFIEEWAFELAYLYHRAGESDRCVGVCDELVLWFGDGKYVEKALEMKMLYEPLNPEQEEKYRQFKQYGDGEEEVHPSDMLESREIIQEEVGIPDIAAGSGRFNTSNLQEEIAKSMQQIMDANSKETVTDTMDNIKKMVEDIPYLNAAQGETELTEEQYGYIETDEEIDSTLKTQFEELLAEEWDGQVRMSVQGGNVREPQVNGQMKIEDVLSDWEKTKIAAQTAMATAQERRLVSAKARALQEANELLDRLHEIIPKLEAGATPQELLEERYLHNLPPDGRGMAYGEPQENWGEGYPQPSQEWEEGHPQPGQEWNEGYPQPGQEWEGGYPQPSQEWEEDYPQPGQGWEEGYPQPGQEWEEGYPQPGQEWEEGYPQPSQERKEDYPQPGQEWQESYPQPGQGWEEGYPQPGQNLPEGNLPLQQSWPEDLEQTAVEADTQTFQEWEKDYPQPGQNGQESRLQHKNRGVGHSTQQEQNGGIRQVERSWEEELQALPPDWGRDVQELPPGWGGELQQAEAYPQMEGNQQARGCPHAEAGQQAEAYAQPEGIQQTGEHPVPTAQQEKHGTPGRPSASAGRQKAGNSFSSRGYPKAGKPLPAMGPKRAGRPLLAIGNLETGTPRPSVEKPETGTPRPFVDNPETGTPRPSVDNPETGTLRPSVGQPETGVKQLPQAALDEISSWEETSKILGEPIPKEYLAEIKREINRRVQNLSKEDLAGQEPVFRQDQAWKESVAQNGLAPEEKQAAKGKDVSQERVVLEQEHVSQGELTEGEKAVYQKGPVSEVENVSHRKAVAGRETVSQGEAAVGQEDVSLQGMAPDGETVFQEGQSGRKEADFPEGMEPDEGMKFQEEQSRRKEANFQEGMEPDGGMKFQEEQSRRPGAVFPEDLAPGQESVVQEKFGTGPQVISQEEAVPGPQAPDASQAPLEELIEQQAIQQTMEQEERDADKYLQSVFQAARESREEKASLPKIKIEEPEGHIRKLSPEQKEIFSYFVPISGMEQQLCQALEGVLHRKAKAHTSSSGNILIMGGRGSGKTVLATDFIKAIQKSGSHPHGKVGKINGASLNQKDLGKLMKKVAGGYLIIEKAGDVSRETAVRLSCLMDQDTDGLLVIMEDTRKGIEKVLGQDSNFAQKFTEKIKIPIFTSDELVQFARIYALEQECEIDDVGILALYNRISNIQKLDEATTLTEVKEIIDEAIHRAERGGLKKLFGGKKFSPEGNLYLREKDFED